jgi:hypothetical protein
MCLMTNATTGFNHSPEQTQAVRLRGGHRQVAACAGPGLTDAASRRYEPGAIN